MRKPIEIIHKRNQFHNPNNGSNRIKYEIDGTNHLETFYNGSWRYSRKINISK